MSGSASFEELHCNKRVAFVLANVVNRTDIWVIKGRCRLRLALKTGQSLRISGHVLGQKLQGDETMEPGVLGLVHHTHPAPAELLDDAVVRDGLADHAQECYGGRVGKSMKAVGLAVSQENVGHGPNG